MDRTGHGAPQAVNVGQSKPEDESATEDSSKLQLGALFSENAQALSTSELKLIMDRVVQSRKEKQGNIELSPVTQKTIEYVNRFYVFDNVEAMDQLRFSLANAGMHEFEVGALMNLCPDSADEARALVMSLENIKEEREDLADDGRLQKLLDELRSYRATLR